MKNYTFAIDETGSFSLNEGDHSFVCGVLISQDEQNLKNQYQQAYTEFGHENSLNDTQTLIGNEAFHFADISDTQKEICKKLLLPLADRIYISNGKPALFANNQNWWLVAVTVVIHEFLNAEQFEKGDDVKILIDNRSLKVVGVFEPIDHNTYHRMMKKQIENLISSIAKAREITVKIQFLSDTSSFFVNLADIVCGFVRTDRKKVVSSIITCSCSRFMSGDDPSKLMNTNPVAAVSLIFQEIVNNKLNNLPLLENNLLKKIASDSTNYYFVWDMFYDLLKSKIKERENNSNLIRLKLLVNIFLDEIKKETSSKKILASKRIEFINLFAEYFSHIGETQLPFEKDFILNEIQNTSQQSETRIMRKWDNYISYSLKEAQIFFNAYNFEESVDNFEKIWGEQEKIIDSLPSFIADKKKDEHTTAVIGTLAQSYAYNGEYEKAIESFEMSATYAIKTSKRTASYLFTIYHQLKDIGNARKYFKMQTEKTPEEYILNNEFKNVWELLNYCKLCALELYLNHSTNLVAVDLSALENYNSEYPFPIIQKWEGIALWLENPDANKPRVEKYFTDAITNLLQDENGFAIKTLALSIIQCYALVNSQNSFQGLYNKILNEYKRTEKFFCKFIDEKKKFSNSIKNDSTIWDRATMLPFIYS